MSNYQTLIVDVEDGVGRILLNRPKAQNAYTPTMGAEIARAFAEHEKDPNVKAIVFGSGRKVFCAGFDFRESDFSSLKSDGNSVLPAIPGQRRGALFALGCNKPTIAAIQGAAIGVGITAPLTCDLKVACKSAKIGFIFSRRGIVPEAASSFLLPKLIGAARSLEIFYLGDIVPAENKVFDGLFNRLVDKPEDVLPAAMDLAKTIAKNTSPLSNAFIKQLVWHPMETPEEQTVLEGKFLAWAGGKPDSIESGKAFMEKREPKFTTRVPEDLPDFFHEIGFGVEPPKPKAKI